MPTGLITEEPLWYKDAVIYQVHVKSYFDSDDDGTGDFTGLIQKLDYLEDLGVTAIWLLPFYPSPMKDDGYDISSYIGVNEAYGSLEDFSELLIEAHKRGIRIITELVLNHTSDQHPWFQRARSSPPGSVYRNYYVWSEDPEKYSDARIIFQDFETSNWTWDPKAKAYFWHRFYSHQPDLNFENPRVKEEMFEIIDFWFSLGVDGMRLDAVPYLFEREGTDCENLEETHEVLRELRSHIDSRFKDKMLLAEANQWPEDAAAYFGEGNECHMAFHFPLMPRLFMAVRMEDPFPIIDILKQTPEITESAQWALFLRNHDELTLEMVTDEERDFMYRSYARDRKMKINLGIRRRLAPLMDNDRRKIELMNVLLFTLPGTPIIYYGDEIGMGDNYHLGDRDGIRTPMQWSPDKNAGFSKVNPQEIYLPLVIDPEFHYRSLNVEVQERNSHSFLWWMKALIALRRRFRSFGRGGFEFVRKDNPKVLAYTRRLGEEVILVVSNLSRYAQPVKLEIQDLAGYNPVDLFGWSRFPAIRGEYPYVMTLGGFEHLIFFMIKEEEELDMIGAREIPTINLEEDWMRSIESKKRIIEKKVLPGYLQTCRWFGGKAKVLHKVEIINTIPLTEKGSESIVMILRITYADGTFERYLLPLSFAFKDSSVEKDHPRSVVTMITNGREGALYDSVYDRTFQKILLDLILRENKLSMKGGTLISKASKRLRDEYGNMDQDEIKTEVLKGEQSNTSIIYKESFILKLYRKLEDDTNPEMETLKFLTERTDYQHVPDFLGSVELKRSRNTKPALVALLMEFVSNEGNAFDQALFSINRFFEEVLTSDREPPVRQSNTNLIDQQIEYGQDVRDMIGEIFLENMRLLARRTGELHLALSSDHSDPDFRPETFSWLYQRSLFQGAEVLTSQVMGDLERRMDSLPEDQKEQALKLLKREKELVDTLKDITRMRIDGKKIRVHGDFHLGQVLFTGKDFYIFDFEGEPARSLSERRLKYSPLKDLTGLIRSLDYVVQTVLGDSSFREKDLPILRSWGGVWYDVVSSAFVEEYLETMKGSGMLPGSREGLEVLFKTLLLEKAIYELGYELNNRPDRISIPISGITGILEASGK